MSEKRDVQFYQEVMDICLTAGRLMIEGGSEMYRVEDTMLRIARNAGIDDPRFCDANLCFHELRWWQAKSDETNS